MKKAIVIIFSSLWLFAGLPAPAQGTLYLSNLGQTQVGNSPAGSDSWLAEPIRTGTAPGGYVLDSVQLLMSAATGNPSGFSVSIYNPVALPSGVFPGNSLGSLIGSDPVAGGIHTYTASGIMLAPLTTYFVVVTAATPMEEGAFNWSYANSSFISNQAWLLNNYICNSSDGINWNRTRGLNFQLGVYATAIPEPTSFVLSGLGLVCLRFFRRKTGRNPAR
jgi:hypothetical protein